MDEPRKCKYEWTTVQATRFGFLVNCVGCGKRFEATAFVSEEDGMALVPERERASFCPFCGIAVDVKIGSKEKDDEHTRNSG